MKTYVIASCSILNLYISSFQNKFWYPGCLYRTPCFGVFGNKPFKEKIVKCKKIDKGFNRFCIKINDMHISDIDLESTATVSTKSMWLYLNVHLENGVRPKQLNWLVFCLQVIFIQACPHVSTIEKMVQGPLQFFRFSTLIFRCQAQPRHFFDQFCFLPFLAMQPFEVLLEY